MYHSVFLVSSVGSDFLFITTRITLAIVSWLACAMISQAKAFAIPIEIALDVPNHTKAYFAHNLG
jgi:hypothetical protein